MNKRLKLLREQLNLTQTIFGAKLGVTLQSVQNYEKEGYKIPAYITLLLEHVFGVNIEWLKTGKGEMLTKSKKEIEKKVNKEVYELFESLDRDKQKEALNFMKYLKNNLH